MAFLEVKNVRKVYTARFGAMKVQALNNVNFSVEEGEYVAIMGESGSGKTTLLNILASLDKATSGQVLLNGRDLSEIKAKELCAFRRNHLGFVFQDFNLLDTLSLRDNIFCLSCWQERIIGKWRKGLNLWRRNCPLANYWINILMKYPADRNSVRQCAGL